MNLFELAAKITLDSSAYDKGVEQATTKGKTLAETIGGGLKKAGKFAAAALGAGATAAATLTGLAVKGYSAYEQLVGGVETLFKESADTVKEYANRAYETAGLSANEYMETVTGFSASLLQSLGGDTQKAAEYADMAISDMSDNANKMGSSMESIQFAYQGFAKQNYTMLDNLKLGYGGTKEEMQRLLADANELNAKQGIYTDYQIENYGDIIDAIHTVQAEMGIYGTTAKEASTTIEGSVNAMKASWKNLVTGMANGNADMSELIDIFVENVATVGKNITPVFTQALAGIGSLVSGLAPVVSEALPEVVSTVLPSLLQSGADLVHGVIKGVVNAVPAATKAITKAFPEILKTGGNIVLTLINGIYSASIYLVEAAGEIVSQFGTALSDGLPTLIPVLVDRIVDVVESLTSPPVLNSVLQAGLGIIVGLGQGILSAIPVLIEYLPDIITNILQFIYGSIPMIIQAGVDLLTSLVDDLPSILETIVLALPDLINGIINAILDNYPKVMEAGFTLLTALIEDLPNIVATLAAAAPQIVESIIDALTGNIGKIIETGVELFISLVSNLPAIIAGIVKAVPEIISSLVESFASMHSKIAEAGVKVVEGIKDGIKSAWSSLVSWFNGIWDGLFGNRTVSVNVQKTQSTVSGKGGGGISRPVNGSHADGLGYVPFDGYIAELHKGERVLTAREADDYNRRGNTTIIQNIHSEAKTAADLMSEALYQQERAVLLGV